LLVAILTAAFAVTALTTLADEQHLIEGLMPGEYTAWYKWDLTGADSTHVADFEVVEAGGTLGTFSVQTEGGQWMLVWPRVLTPVDSLFFWPPPMEGVFHVIMFRSVPNGDNLDCNFPMDVKQVKFEVVEGLDGRNASIPLHDGTWRYDAFWFWPNGSSHKQTTMTR
jgi:hypothetical protein